MTSAEVREEFWKVELFSMLLVKVKSKYQVTLPDVLRQVQVGVGDLLEAKVEKGKITLTPKSVVDRDITGGLEDFSRGSCLALLGTLHVLGHPAPCPLPVMRFPYVLVL